MKSGWKYVVLGMMLLSLGAGCRAMGGKDKGAAAGAPLPDAAKPVAAPQPPPPASTNNAQLSNNNEYFRKDLLREALGQSGLKGVDPSQLVFDKIPSKGAADPNTLVESGSLKLDQNLGGTGATASALHFKGPYQRVKVISGAHLVSFGPVVVDISVKDLAVQSLCEFSLKLSGKIQCTVSGVYDGASHIMDAGGQCMTHTNGIWDNLQIDVAGDAHTARYVLGVKIHGDPLDWKSYNWVGNPYVDGLNTEIPMATDTKEKCVKQ